MALLQGRDADVKSSFILQARDGVVEFGRAVQTAVTGVILPALKGILAVLNTVAQAFNAMFGTDISGQAIAITLILTKLIGLFGVLKAGIAVAVSTVQLLAVAFGATNLALVVLAAAVGFFIVKSIGGLQGIQAAWTATWAAIASFVNRELNGIAVIAGGLVTAFNAVIEGIVAAFTNSPRSASSGVSSRRHAGEFGMGCDCRGGGERRTRYRHRISSGALRCRRLLQVHV